MKMVQNILVIDDHEAVLAGTVSFVCKLYPQADIAVAHNRQEVEELMKLNNFDVIISDLSLPAAPGELSEIDVGISMLREIMKCFPHLNIVVQSAHVRSLIRLKPTIDNHQGGFTIADKNLPLTELKSRIDWAVNGLLYISRDLRSGLEFKPEWLEVLDLAFTRGFQDKAIAEEMNVAERTIRHYWSKIRDALSVYPDSGRNIRIQTEIRAREEGLIE